MGNLLLNRKHDVMRAQEAILNDSGLAMLNKLKMKVYECGKAKIVMNINSGVFDYSMEFNEKQQETIDWCDREISKARNAIADRYNIIMEY